jgi:tryptophan-rich sensory protein
MNTRKRNALGFLIAIILPFVVAGIGGLATSSSVSTWYPSLTKPSWNPPAWVFGPVWTFLYLSMGLASWLVWREDAADRDQIRNALGWYGGQLGLNALWSVLFFGLQRIGLALVEIVILLATLLITTVKFSNIRRSAAWLLIPYVLWVSFATILNAAIWWLN